MYKNKKILGVITARGGSKGIPRKNIKPLNGKPLIAHTILASNESKFLTRSIVSTDDKEIADISREHGADVPFLRPSELAGDTSTSIDVVQHALGWLKEHDKEQYDYVMILQPTSPFRTSEDIDACIEKIIDTNADSVMSMVELSDFSVKKLKVIEDDAIRPFIEEEGKISEMRQAAVPVYKRNCAIYLTRTKYIQEGDMFGIVSRPYTMPSDRSIDINTPLDFEFAEFLMSVKK